MAKLSLDMFFTLGVAVVALLIGSWLRKNIKILDRFCIPSPVIGGLIFAAITCVLYQLGIVEVSFDETLKTVCMVIFFTSIGFQANVKVLKSGGIAMIILMICILVLTEAQNILALAVSHLLGVEPLIGLSTGSIAMVGGPGTAAAFGPVIEDLGIEGATTFATAAATFGLVAGSLVGGPLGNYLVVKKHLVTAKATDHTYTITEDKVQIDHRISQYAPATYQLAIAMGLGTLVSQGLSMTGLTFPIYIGSMIIAAIMRNISEFTGKFPTPIDEIAELGDISLSLFLGMAMISLKLWLLADLAIPLLILLGCQVLFMTIFARYIIFNAMGHDYDAAVLTAGSCGFGLGATPNAMANMQVITNKYGPSVKAFLLVPIIGSMYADFINSISITFFINILPI